MANNGIIPTERHKMAPLCCIVRRASEKFDSLTKDWAAKAHADMQTQKSFPVTGSVVPSSVVRSATETFPANARNEKGSAHFQIWVIFMHLHMYKHKHT